MNAHIQDCDTRTKHFTLLALLTPIRIDGLAMGDGLLFRTPAEAEQYLEKHRLLRDRNLFETLLIPCRAGRG